MLRTIREAGRSRFGAALVVAIGVVLSAGAASASVIAGPVLNTNDSGWVDSGLGFTAIVNSTLTSFTFQNQGLADTVVLVDPLGNILDQVATAAGVFSNTVSVNWSLTAGSNYYLLQTTQNNGVFTDWGLAAPFNADIALTDTGDWSNNGLASANFGIGGAQSFAKLRFLLNDTSYPSRRQPGLMSSFKLSCYCKIVFCVYISAYLICEDTCFPRLA
jgi:hypothetical protein